MTPPFSVVITTVQEPTSSLRRLATALALSRAPLVIIGDKKGPPRFDLPGATLFSLADQGKLPFGLSRLLPTGHYARKNLGYLLAIREGAPCLYETDDDNAPNEYWAPRALNTEAEEVRASSWFNVYRVFSDELIWPRGFPLNLLRDPKTYQFEKPPAPRRVEAPIQQGLADLSPDVDATWRLLLDREVRFNRRASLWLPHGAWCPFNSQTTWWYPVAYPLLYLPSLCTFRMTDIWRSLIAQRCLWALGYGLVFHSAEVVQERNVHDLMRDFKDEVPGYLGNEEIARRLIALNLSSERSAVGANMLRCYEHLIECSFLPTEELTLVRAWLEDLARLSAC